jgi:ligand-binding sensor domain-containing protein/signal transduction histidine kinase
MRWLATRLAMAALPLCLAAELLPIRSYSTADGLAGDRINQIVADSHGFIWFCTPEGLSRFDGFRMKTYGRNEGLPHQSVHTLLETRSGEYIVGTSRGLCRFQGGVCAGALLPGSNRRANAVTVLLEDSSGKIWVGTGAGLFELLNGNQFRRQPLPAHPLYPDGVPILDLVEDARHNLWVASTDGIFIVRDSGDVQYLTRKDGLPNNWVDHLLLDKQRRLWAGTRGGLALMRDVNESGMFSVQQTYKSIGKVKLDVHALAQGPDGEIWIGSQDGIMRSGPGGSPLSFRILTRAQGLIDRSITALASDQAGNMWAGTEGAGVMKIQSGGFTTFGERDGLASDRVFSVLADRKGGVLAVTILSANAVRSLDVFNGLSFSSSVPKVFGAHSTWGQDQILLQSHAGEWWAATKVGLCRFPAVTAAKLARTAPSVCYARDSEIFRVFEDSHHRIWASAQHPGGDRLMRWDPATNSVSSCDEAAEGLVSAFAEDRAGNIWLGYWGGGVARYDGRQFVRFDREQGLPPGTIFALLVDDSGKLWIGAIGGLGLVENPADPKFQVKLYSGSNPPPAKRLASDTIYCIVEDKAGRIYACTAKGVDRLNPATGDVKHFSAADGLAHGELTSALRDGSGDLWFATKQGLSRLTPRPDRLPSIPLVRITDLRVGSDRYPVSQAGETLVQRGDLPSSQNELQFEFVGFNNEPEQSLRYTYNLQGGDSGWQGPGREHEANYPGLGPGRYRFLVKAVNSEGGESITPAEVDFEILPPVWRRWWFEGLAAAGLAGLIFGAHRYRVSQLVRIERMRTTIATDLHDDIGASLSQIAILSEVARSDAQASPPGAGDRLERIASLARDMVDSMSDIVWSIRVEPEGMEPLIRRMREYAIDLLESQAIGFELRAPQNILHLRLSLQGRRHLFLIFKECIHNAARHSHGSLVTSEFQVVDREILLLVRDNGVGENNRNGSQKKNGGTGIPSMKRRAESLGGRIEWSALPGAGCTVEVRVPIRRGVYRKSHV